MINENIAVVDERIEKLQHLTTHHLIDVVKNYQQHHYTEEIRESALLILKERGITEQSLKLSGKLENRKYETVQNEYHKFKSNSAIALALYILAFFMFSGLPIVSVIFYAASLIFVGCSFGNTKKLSKLLNDRSIDYSIIFVFFSVVIYIVMFFVVRAHIKEKIKFMT